MKSMLDIEKCELALARLLSNWKKKTISSIESIHFLFHPWVTLMYSREALEQVKPECYTQ